MTLRTNRKPNVLIVPWLMAMLLISASLFTGCGSRKSPPVELVVIPADKQVIALPDGNYQVTPAWLQERYAYEAWITGELERCRQERKEAQ